MALATPNQLYRLNKLGWLVVMPDSQSMTHVEADVAIKKAMGLCSRCGDPLCDWLSGDCAATLEAQPSS